MRFSLAAVCSLHVAEAFCPAGFADGGFPAEWKIPTWPQDLPEEVAAKHRIITLVGFTQDALNDAYLEGPTKEFVLMDNPTFWNANGEYFLYYCQRFAKWRISAVSGWADNAGGSCLAFASDTVKQRDIFGAKNWAKGWIEVEDGEWKQRPEAGVESMELLGEHLPGGSEDPDNENEACDTAAGDGDGKENSSCPVMPVVRKARDKAKKAGKKAARWAMRWVRRLFPLLAPPESVEEEAEREAEEAKFTGDEAPTTDTEKTEESEKKE